MQKLEHKEASLGIVNMHFMKVIPSLRRIHKEATNSHNLGALK
jgi:hypothetical protein